MSDTEFGLINRTAMALTIDEPFIAWLKSVDPTFEIFEEAKEGNIYLLPDFESKAEIEEWLEINFDIFFSEELNGWYVDERLWVQNRTFVMFKQFFKYSLHPMVFDLLDEDQ